MPLHPQARTFLDEFAAAGIPMPWEVATPAEARAVLAGLQVPPEQPIEVARIEERQLELPDARIAARIFVPEGEPPFPTILWFHGGGWVVGSLDESDTTCRSLCRRSGAIVVCPDYRMAPEHPFPAAAEDCYATTCWIAEHGAEIGADPTRIAVAGDSAGGNLAAVTALMARDRGTPEIRFQLLVYPVVGLPSDGRQSYEDFADGYFLTRGGMEWFTEQYTTSPQDLESPYLAPLQADDLSGLPPALVMTAGYDPLCDEGEEYARRLQESGVDCTLTRYESHIHAFFVLTDVFDAAFEAHDRAAAAMREALATS